MSEDAPKAPSQEVKEAGRGVIYIALAKMYFMVAGAVIEFRLPAILSRAVFGAYAVVASTVSPINNVLIVGSIQAVSRFTAQTPEKARAIQRAGFRMHLYIGIPVALLFIAMAPVLAWAFHDMSKTGPLMLAGLIVLGYSFYAVFVGTANGRREFHKQAALDVSFATLRAGLILGLTIAGLGLYGAISGWVIAVGCILVLASIVIGLPKFKDVPSEDVQPLKPLMTFFAGVAVYLIVMNLVMFADQLLLKRMSAEWFREHASRFAHIADWTAAKAADEQVGYYRAVQNLARLSYQAIIAATFVIFPLVSRSTFANDSATTHRYIHTTVRYSIIFAMAIAVVFAANPLPMLDIPYASDYAYFGAPALAVLAMGNVAFAVFAIAGTILNGAGYTRDAIITAGVTLTIAVVGNAIAIPQFEPGRDVLLACAIASSSAMLVGALLGGWFMHKRLGAFMPLTSALRVTIAGAAAIGLGQLIHFKTPLMTLVEGTIVGLSFLLALIIMGELNKRDLNKVLSVVRSKRGGS